MARSDNISDRVGMRCGILATILAIAGILTWPSGALGFLVIPLSLVFAGISSLFRNTILSTAAVIITTINCLFLMGESLRLGERYFVGIPYFFAVTCIVISILRNRVQNQREMNGL